MEQDKILNRIRKVLDLAAGASSESEREAALAKADAMMAAHAVDEAIVRATQRPEERATPVAETIDIPKNYASDLRNVIVPLATLADCRIAEGRQIWRVAGFRADVDYLQLIWTNVHLELARRIDARWDEGKSFDENVTALHDAGWKWQRLQEEAARHGHDVSWPDGGKLIRAYRRQCKREGRPANTGIQRHAAYRASFVTSYCTRLADRIREMRYARERALREREDRNVGSGAELAVRDSRAQVEDFWYQLYPQLHPDAMRATTDAWRAEQAQAAQERQALLDGMTDAQRAAYLRREAEQADRRARADERWSRQYYARQASKHDSKGAQAGATAAEHVQIGRDSAVGTTTRTALGG
jgi:hypothetical protein